MSVPETTPLTDAQEADRQALLRGWRACIAFGNVEGATAILAQVHEIEDGY